MVYDKFQSNLANLVQNQHNIYLILI
ncbi:hypothetical protein LCGC14_2457060, partial [marine sediment metagenome]